MQSRGNGSLLCFALRAAMQFFGIEKISRSVSEHISYFEDDILQEQSNDPAMEH
jgi:hypothetical protein